MRLICIFSLPYISLHTVTCPRLSHSAIIHPVLVLILSKDISDAERTDANPEMDDINTKQYLDMVPAGPWSADPQEKTDLDCRVETRLLLPIPTTPLSAYGHCFRFVVNNP